MKPQDFIVINKETGEMWRGDVIEMVAGLDYPEDAITYLHVEGSRFTAENISRIKELDGDEKEEAEHPLFGKYIYFNDNRRFTKLSQLEAPEFSCGTYLGYWTFLITSLQKDTNIITIKDPYLRACSSKTDLRKLARCSEMTFNKFYKEASSKRVIASLVFDKETYYLMNPKYAYNGRRMPEVLYELFNNPLKSAGKQKIRGKRSE